MVAFLTYTSSFRPDNDNVYTGTKLEIQVSEVQSAVLIQIYPGLHSFLLSDI